MEVIYPGVPKQPAVSNLSHLSNRGVTFLFVGGDFVRKNGEMVVNAFRQVHRCCSDARLILIGRPVGGRVYTHPGVLHRHFVPRNELAAYYSQADVFLAPSKVEGFGLVLVEAMAAGVPTIASNAWAMPEIITHGVNGFLICPNNLDELATYMLMLACDSERLRHLKVQAEIRFQAQFSIEQHNSHLKAVYERVSDHGSSICPPKRVKPTWR